MGSVEQPVERSDAHGLSRVAWRILPLPCVAFVVCILDRINLSFAAAHMNADLGLSAAAYGMGAGLFFLGYLVFEIPSNILLARIGARRWIARIMVSWGLVSAAMALITGPASFYTVRLLLGVAEAGFVPGVIYFVNQWFPASYVRRPMGVLFVFGPLGSAIGAPLSLFLIEHLGWRWMFVLEALPAIATGIAIFYLLPDPPTDAPGPRRSLASALFERSSILLAIQYFLILTTAYTIQLWLPLIAQELGFTAGQLTWVVAIPYGLSAVAIGLYGLFTSASTSTTGWVVGSMLVTAAGFFVGATTSNLPLALLCFCLVMVGTYLGAAAYWTTPRPIVTGAGAAAAIALSNACGNLGGFFGPVFTGLAREHFGNYQAALAVSGVVSVAAAVMSFFNSTVRGPRISDHDNKQTYPA